LFTALAGILVKQWLHVYSKWSEGARSKHMLMLRDFYRAGFDKWHLTDIVDGLSLLLQLALLLFVVGLVAYLWKLNVAVAIVATVLVLIMVVLAVITIALPAVYADCPYKTPVGLLLRPFFDRSISDMDPWGKQIFVRKNLRSWRDRDWARIQKKAEEKLKDPVDRVLQAVSIVLNISQGEVREELKRDQLEGSLTASRINELPAVILRLLRDLVIPSTTDPNSAEYWFASAGALQLLRLLEYVTRLSIERHSLSEVKEMFKIVEHSLDSQTDASDVHKFLVACSFANTFEHTGLALKSGVCRINIITYDSSSDHYLKILPLSLFSESLLFANGASSSAPHQSI
jgi:hypothetical protein